MSISLYCGRCRNYMGHHNPAVPRNPFGRAEDRRNFNNVCKQCEAIEGLYEARIHAREMWNASMRGHDHIIEACRRTIAAISPGYQPNLKYTIGRGGYTVLQPARKHSSMLQAFTDQDALCLLRLEGTILSCPESQIRDYHVSPNFATWCALMRHVECSKMTRDAVARIVNTYVTLIKQEWTTWEEDLAPALEPPSIAVPEAGSSGFKRRKAQQPVVKGVVRKPVVGVVRKTMMTKLGAYFSSNLTRSEAQESSSVSSQGMAYTPIPRTPPRPSEDDDF